MTDLSELIARVENSDGADAALNEQVLRFFGWTENGGIAYRPDGSRALHIPDMTTSIDSVMEIFPEGVGLRIFLDPGIPKTGISPSRSAFARALLAAILRMKEDSQ